MPPGGGDGVILADGGRQGGLVLAEIANVATIDNETLDVGKELGASVSADYDGPFGFTGTIDHVTLDLK